MTAMDITWLFSFIAFLCILIIVVAGGNYRDSQKKSFPGVFFQFLEKHQILIVITAIPLFAVPVLGMIFFPNLNNIRHIELILAFTAWIVMTQLLKKHMGARNIKLFQTTLAKGKKEVPNNN